MFGWSPPNILATLVLFISLLLLFDRSPTQAKPYPKQNILSTYTAGNLGGFNDGNWPELLNYKNGHYIERDKRSPTEVEDESPNVSEGKTISVKPGKRQGIETPIQPLTSDSGLDKDTFPRLNGEENVRSKVDQPESELIGVSVEEEKKAVDDTTTDSSTARPVQESTENAKSSNLKSEESNDGQEKEHDSSTKENVEGVQQEESDHLKTKDKADLSSAILDHDEGAANKLSGNKGNNEAEPSRPVDENAQVRSVQDSGKLGNVPSDKNGVRFSASSPQLYNSQSNSDVKQNSQETQTRIGSNINKQVNVDTKITTAKVEATGTTTPSKDQNTAAAPSQSNTVSSTAKTQSSSQENAAIHTVPQMQNVPVEPVRDALGNSGSEIVTTRGASDLDSYTERDTEPKPSNGPEVGHFQVDDKSADLEINANSAGVKVKAKPASLQVVSRPGSHSPSAAAQERSLYHHYHYPPYHPHHHWYPGMRRSYGHFHSHHLLHPYHSFPERRGFDSFYDEAPFYRRHMRYWYPRRHRHHFHDSELYERSRMEEPDSYPKYRGRRRHKRRFRHMNGPYRRQFYNNIPIMNGMESPQMGMMPEEGTMPQLPIGGGMPFTQRQNIITPMPAPINIPGNPPPGLLGGVNAANFAMNGLNGINGLNNFNELNQMNSLNAFNGISGIHGINNMGTMGLNSLGQMGTMEGLPSGFNSGMEGNGNAGGEIPGTARELGTRNANTPTEIPRMAFKKTKILSNKKSKSVIKVHANDHKIDPKRNSTNVNFEKTHSVESKKQGKVNIKSWEKTLKRYHRLNVFTSKAQERHQFRRNTKSSGKSETNKKDEEIKGKHNVSHLHAQHAKDQKGNRKNAIVMHRPPIIYHPPPEIYHRPDIVVHRAPIMLHRPPIIYHQPPVVVHRPAIIYHQPPIVFHQPPPVVHQPILRSHDTWVTKPMVYHTASMVSHAKTYYGIPSHVYSGDYGEGCHGAHCSYRKGRVPHGNTTQVKNNTHSKEHKKKSKRDSFSDYMAYFTSLWKPKGLTKREIDDGYEFISSTDGAKEKLNFRNMNFGHVDKRDTIPKYHSWNPKAKRETEKGETEDSKDDTQKKKKKDVVVNRPPIIYHPPPEIYHRPDIVVHRPPLVIHRPPIIYHQPPVIVHRPAVVYHQPPIVFHQPPPAVSQPLLYSHDSFTVHPSFYATHHGSVVRDFGHYVGVPNVITNYGNPLFGRAPPIGKRSKIETSPSKENTTSLNNDKSTAAASKRGSFEDHDNKAKNESNENAGKKNTVVVSRPPIIYHPPPEIYHRPIIVVHRPPIMIHRAPIFYHQPPVVVHRPAIVYHQPPLVFHQPPPMVHQPVLKSHDTWVSHPMVIPYSSRVLHHHTYVGVPDAYTVHHFGGHGNSFYKSHILKHSKSLMEEASERNEITGQNSSTKLEKDSSNKSNLTTHHKKHRIASKLKTKKSGSQKGGKKNAVIVRRPPVIYHPPPEIYHRPEIVVHRAPIVIHRAPIIYHQPPVIVHRPAIVYHQPAIIFHQPPPVVHQPVFRSHDTYVRRPVVRLYGSRMHHAGHLYHIPHAYFHGHGGIHYMAYGKSRVPQKESMQEEKGDTRATVKSMKRDRKSRTEKSNKKTHHNRRKHIALTRSKDKTETGIKLHKNHGSPYHVTYHKAKEVTEKANKKNSVVIHRPPIIYHPPPEIYHRPDIVVHRAPIVLYRAPIVYHQPPVVVHRPAIVYHQPPIVFHQPPPMVHQPVLHSHDTWVTKPVVVPYASHVRHVATYKGVPHEEIFMHGIGTGAFGKSHVPITGTRRNKIDGVKSKNQTGEEDPTDQEKNPETPTADDTEQLRAGNNKLGARKRIVRALTDSLVDEQWNFVQNRKPVGGGTRIQRSLVNLLPLFGYQHSAYSSEYPLNLQGYDQNPEGAVGAARRIQRSIEGAWNPYIGPQTNSVTTPVVAGTRVKRALADPQTPFEVYNALDAAPFQNQVFVEPEVLPHSNGIRMEHLPGFASSLRDIQEVAGAGIARSSFPLSLQEYLPTAQKENSPDVRVHVETTKSSIPLKKREKRQIFPIYQQQGPSPLPRVLYQPPSLGDLGVEHVAAPSSVYNLFSPYQQALHTMTGPFHYLPFASQLHHRPRVNINVQSARSTIPDMEHVLEKRSKESKSKRQLLAVVPPISAGIPLGLHGLEGAGIMRNFLPYSPYSTLPRFFFPTFPHAEETKPEETSYPEALPLLRRPAQQIHNLYSTLLEDDGGESPTFNPWASYLSALYHNYLGYPLYRSHHKPKVHVDVQASKSHIPKATKMEKKQDSHSRPRISKRQIYHYLPDSTLTSHYTLPTALNYGVQGFPFHRNSPHININVETAKKNGIPSIRKERRSSKVGYTKHLEEQKTGNRRDELIGGENGQEITQNQGNPDFSNAPENQFVATSEEASREEGATSNDNEQLQGQDEVAQQQAYREMAGQGQEIDQNSVQRMSSSQGQPIMIPAQAQQLAFRGSNLPLQTPIQQSLQAPLQAPFQAQPAVSFQGMLSNGLPAASVLPVSEQSVPQQAIPQQPIQTEEEQPKHTTINVNVAAKSTVPKKHYKRVKNTLHKRQFVASTQGLIPAYGAPIPYNGAIPVPKSNNPRVSINVQTTKKSAVEKDNNKRQSISLLTRFPAMQVLPQTFKQNGILMPAFNTLPVNHKIKANGMLLEELQRQRKYKIPKMGGKRQTGLSSNLGQSPEMSKGQSKQKENVKKRQFYAAPQSPLAVHQYPYAIQPVSYQRPQVSVNVEVSKRKSSFPGRKHHGLLLFKSAKRRLPSFDERREKKKSAKSKRQVYGIEQLPHMIHLPVVSPPLLSQFPSKNERPRVSVHVETAKKKNKLLNQNKPIKMERRQIYGLSELPHEGLPFPTNNQGQALEYLPSTVHTPRVSVNVEASKRSDEESSHDFINKRQVFGVQAPPAQPFEQTQERSVSINDEEPPQSDDPEQGTLSQYPIQVQEEPQQDQLSSENSSPATLQQQQGQELSSDAVLSQAGVSQIDYQRPHVSVNVEASKRSNAKRKTGTIKNNYLKRNMPQPHQFEQDPEDYEPDVNELGTITRTGTVLGKQRPRVSVKVDVAKKKHDIAPATSKKKIKAPVKRQLTVPFNEGPNTIQGNPIQNTQFMTGGNQEQNEQGVQQVSMLPQRQSELAEEQQQEQPQQKQQQQVMHPFTFVQPMQLQQQIQPFQTLMLPLEHKTQPKVSISVQTAKSLISTNNDREKSFSHHKEREPGRKSRRQLFGTVPLLSSLGQTAVTGSVSKENGRSIVPQSTKGKSIQGRRKDKSTWKRQLYNYLGGQQEQQILPTQSLESISQPPQEQAAIQDFQQDAGAQLTQMNLPQASLAQTNDQEASQQYLTQTEDDQQGAMLATQPQESSVSPITTFQRPHVSINVQTAKSLVPNPERKFHSHELEKKVPRSHLATETVQETKKFKRQFDLLGGGVIERRRGPKFVPEPLKKPRGENLFGLGNNLNKPVEVFTDPISNLVGGGDAGRKRPKLGGIRLDSPTGVGALPLKGADNPLESTLPSDLGAQAILQDSPAETAPPLAQEPGVTSEPLFRPPSGIAGPRLDTLEREGATNFVPSDLPSTGSAILPLPAINRAFLPNLPLPGAPLPQGNPLLLAPQVFPILPFAPPMAAPPMNEPPTMQDTTPELPPAPPRLTPMLPPVIPMPVPNTAPVPALPSLLPEPEEDKPSVHVNVETSRSNVPTREHHPTQHTNGSANRG